MKIIAYVLMASLLIACSSNDEENRNPEGRDLRQDMRNLVIGISQAGKAQNPDFAIVPQNGIELATLDGEADGTVAFAYLNAIDGNGQEDLFYGYDNDDQATPQSTTGYLRSYLDISKNAGNTIFVTDYCSTPGKMADSYTKNQEAGYVSFAAPDRNLAVIPSGQPHNANSNDIIVLSQAKNFIFFINPENYSTKAEFITAVNATNYDVVIMDLFLEDTQFTETEIILMKHKANGGTRLILCYMSIGEAEDYRYYWNPSWNSNRPEWLEAENPDWPGNYKVKYWNEEWQDIIYKNSDSYLNRITAAGFDGVYLDIIDAFEYFEN